MKKKEEYQAEFDSIFRAYHNKKNDSLECKLRAMACIVEVLCDIRSNMVGITKAINPDMPIGKDRRRPVENDNDEPVQRFSHQE